MNKPKYELLSDEDVPENMIIPDEGWAIKIGEAIVCINHLKFADEENEDGSIECDINYDVINLDELDQNDLPDNFGNIVGEIVMEMLEQAMQVRDMKEARKEVKDSRE